MPLISLLSQKKHHSIDYSKLEVNSTLLSMPTISKKMEY